MMCMCLGWPTDICTVYCSLVDVAIGNIAVSSEYLYCVCERESVCVCVRVCG